MKLFFYQIRGDIYDRLDADKASSSSLLSLQVLAGP